MPVSLSRKTVTSATYGVGVAGAAGLVGIVSVYRASLSLLLIAFLVGLGLLIRQPVVIAVAAFPALWGIRDVGIGPSLAVTDVLLVGAAIMSLPALQRTGGVGAGSGALRAFGVYLILLMPSLVAHPSPAAATEIVHRMILVGAAIAVGAWVIREQVGFVALRLLLLASVAIAIPAVVDTVSSGFEPAFPLGFHKNYAGSLLAMVMVLLLAAPDSFKLGRGVRPLAAAILAAGTLATQSRGAVLGAAMGGLLWLFAPSGAGSRVSGRARVVAALLAGGFALYAAYSVQQQFQAANVATNSVGVRQDVEAYTQEIWRSSPLVGVGVRYFSFENETYGGRVSASNNAINSELAESGVLGATGFVVFHALLLAALWRKRRTPLALAALAVVSGRLLHGMFDIYWSSGLSPLPYLLTGMALVDDAHVGASRAS